MILRNRNSRPLNLRKKQLGFLLNPSRFSSGVTPPTFATWNPADKAANVTLSNGDLTAASYNSHCVRATQGKSTGKHYWEVKVDISGSQSAEGIGICTSSHSLTALPGRTAASYVFYGYDGTKGNNNSFSAYAAAYNDPSVIGVALDLDAGTLKFYVNGVDKGVAFTGITGTFYPVMSGGSSGTPKCQVTANFGASQFAHGVPSGYRAGWYTGDIVAETDPHFADVGLLLHMNGTNGSTVVTDSSSSPLTCTAANGAAISTPKAYAMDGATGYFDGVDDLVTVAASSVFSFGTGDFTVQVRANRAGAGTGDRFLLDRGNGASFLLRWSSAGNLQFFINSSLVCSYAFAFTIGTWYTIGVKRVGTTVTLWVNGAQVASGTSSANISSSADLHIGRYGGGAQDGFNGYLEEIRTTKGVARDLSIVATKPFPDA